MASVLNLDQEVRALMAHSSTDLLQPLFTALFTGTLLLRHSHSYQPVSLCLTSIFAM